VLLCQFFVLAGNRLWFYILLMYLEYHTVVVLCWFFWFWREIVFDVGTYLVYNTVVRLCQFFVVVGNSSQNENMFLQKNPIGLLYYDPIADVCI
jgi:hypothetical protein